MKDDLLIKFIDNKCTPEEEEQVFHELSSQGSEASEWVQMLNASRLAGTPAFEQAEGAQEYVSKVLENNRKKTSRVKVFRMSAIVGGICALAASVALFIVYQGNSGMDQKNGGPLAYVQDSLETSNKALKDTISQAHVRSAAQEAPLLAESENSNNAESENQQNLEVSGETVPQVTPSIEYSRNASRAEAADTSASDTTVAVKEQRQKRTLRMTRPSKSPYRVKVKDISKDFVFEWAVEGQVSLASLIIKDSKGTEVVEKQIENPETNALPVEVLYLTDTGELVWTLVLEFPGGEKLSRTGRLEMKSEMD